MAKPKKKPDKVVPTTNGAPRKTRQNPFTSQRPGPAVRQVLKVLNEHYLPAHPQARIDAYRHQYGSIWIRVIDPAFAGTHWMDLEREEPIWNLLVENLPHETLQRIGLLLLLTPREAKKSMMNIEFEDPLPGPF